MAWVDGYFTSQEFACRCGCGAGTDRQDVSDVLLRKLNDLRTLIGPVVLTSAARCVAHNQREGGKTNSAHLTIPGKIPCKAVDIRVTDPQHRAKVITGVQAVGFVRRGEARSFIHVDVGEPPMYPQHVVWTYA